MKLGPLIIEINILCVKLQDSWAPQAIFLENGTFLFLEYVFSLREHYPHFKILKFKLCYPTLNPKKLSPLLKGGMKVCCVRDTIWISIRDLFANLLILKLIFVDRSKVHNPLCIIHYISIW